MIRGPSNAKIWKILSFTFILYALVATLKHTFFYDDPPDDNAIVLDVIRSSPSHVAAALPPACTREQLDMIIHQLPATDCENNENRPWTNRCSFSYATRCPESLWIEEYYTKWRPTGEPFTAIYVGCNKGLDAVNALRMGRSSDAAIDKFAWRDVFFANGSNVARGVCRQELVEQFSLRDGEANPAIVHCLEAMPLTARHLEQTAAHFAWKDRFVVKNAAFSSKDGVTRFSTAIIGTETTGICGESSINSNCQDVPMLRLDTYLRHQNVTSPDSFIDFLLIDVEGNDAEVLLGASETLNRVRYLEFEYNWKGLWKSHSLHDITKNLLDQGFVCYWPGIKGHIWRITDCWLSHYSLRYWSNVACVHTQRHPVVAKRMEDLFLETLKLGELARYNQSVVS